MAHSDRFALAGVMGWPVMHSRSPMIHNAWMAAHGIEGRYLPLAIEPAGLGAALRALAPLGFAGCNLTIPHKEAAMALVDEIDEAARRVGAINCIVAGKDGRLAGRNYDGFGFVQSLVEEHPGWRADSGPALVLGAGGASRAVIVGLAQRGAPDILLANRTLARAQALAAEFGAPVRAIAWEDRVAASEGCALLVNTTSQGMAGEPGLDMPIDRLNRRALVSDIIYIPKETALLAAARARGNPVSNGLGMLLHQARPAFRDWFGVMPDVTRELRAAIEATL